MWTAVKRTVLPTRRGERKEQGKMNWISVKDKLPKEVSSHD